MVTESVSDAQEKFVFKGTEETLEKVVSSFRSPIGNASGPYLHNVHFGLHEKPRAWKDIPGFISATFHSNAFIECSPIFGNKTLLEFRDRDAHPEYLPLKREFLDYLRRGGWLEETNTPVGAVDADQGRTTPIDQATIDAMTFIGPNSEMRKLHLTFAGTVDELLEIVRDWRTFSVEGDPVLSTHFMSAHIGQRGWEMGSRNVDQFTSKRVSNTERIHIGSVDSKPEDDGVIRHVTLRVSLLEFHPMELHLFGSVPAGWRFHPGYFTPIKLSFAQRPDGLSVKLVFPDEVTDECKNLLGMLMNWKASKTDRLGGTDDGKVEEVQRRGAKVGTLDRVREAHRLMKEGMSQRQACKAASTDSRTYYQHCKEATGEEPMLPYR